MPKTQNGSSVFHDFYWLANVANDMFEPDKSAEVIYPPDFVGSMLYLISSELDDREYDIITSRYRDSMTLDEIGAKLGLTRERVRQIETNAIEKLRNSPKAGLASLGMNEFLQQKSEEIKTRAVQRALDIASEQIKSMVGTVDLREKVSEVEREFGQEDPALKESVNILQLSTRTRNCLYKCNLNTIGALLNFMSHESLYSIKSMGKGSVEELCEKLSGLGFAIPPQALTRV
jgi:DNA-binding CsgD family transcriptional regulator